MTMHRPIFGPGRLRVSQVIYNCDISRADGRTIPLGAIADVRAGHWYGLALSARGSVLEDELSCVGRMARPLVEQPFKSLKREFQRIIEARRPSEEFLALPNMHSTSLMVFPMAETTFVIPASIANSDHDVQKGFLENQVGALANKVYWELIAASTHPGLPKLFASAEEYANAA